MDRIVVKFMAKKLRAETAPQWRRQLPDAAPTWGACEFTFDAEARHYDWLVAYDDLSPLGDERFSTRTEALACDPAHTILVTAEPSVIKAYERDFCAQFALVVTSQERWAVEHPNALFVQSGSPWFYGRGEQHLLSYDSIAARDTAEKQQEISTVCSSKASGSNPYYRQRVEFTDRLQAALPGLVRYGKGVRFIDDKADALDAFRYHVAIENDVAPHYFTEKLADPLLALTLPFYYGCPNAADYFPADSFIPIDIFDFEGSLKTIREAMASGQFERRLPALREAKRRVLEEHNLFALLAREIEARHRDHAAAEPGRTLFSRRAMKQRGPGYLWRALRDKRRLRRLRRRHAPPVGPGAMDFYGDDDA